MKVSADSFSTGGEAERGPSSPPSPTRGDWEGYRSRYWLFLSVALVCFGAGMITVAFFVPPVGEIDPSVLTAFGEILTFAGSLMGIDYHYRCKN